MHITTKLSRAWQYCRLTINQLLETLRLTTIDDKGWDTICQTLIEVIILHPKKHQTKCSRQLLQYQNYYYNLDKLRPIFSMYINNTKKS